MSDKNELFLEFYVVLIKNLGWIFPFVLCSSTIVIFQTSNSNHILVRKFCKESTICWRWRNETTRSYHDLLDVTTFKKHPLFSVVLRNTDKVCFDGNR